MRESIKYTGEARAFMKDPLELHNWIGRCIYDSPGLAKVYKDKKRILKEKGNWEHWRKKEYKMLSKMLTLVKKLHWAMGKERSKSLTLKEIEKAEDEIQQELKLFFKKEVKLEHINHKLFEALGELEKTSYTLQTDMDRFFPGEADDHEELRGFHEAINRIKAFCQMLAGRMREDELSVKHLIKNDKVNKGEYMDHHDLIKHLHAHLIGVMKQMDWIDKRLSSHAKSALAHEEKVEARQREKQATIRHRREKERMRRERLRLAREMRGAYR